MADQVGRPKEGIGQRDLLYLKIQYIVYFDQFIDFTNFFCPFV
jgi:hypothetical protein